MDNSLNINKLITIIATVLLLASGNGNAAQSASDIDQSDICPVDKWDIEISQCKVGQKIAFLPTSWGNEQLPLNFVAMNCDLKYSVAMTNAGVVCIYRPIKPTKK